MHDPEEIVQQLAHLQTRLAELELAQVRERSSWREPLERLAASHAEDRAQLREEQLELMAQLGLMTAQLAAAETTLATRTEEVLVLKSRLDELAEVSRGTTRELELELGRTRSELAAVERSGIQDLQALEARVDEQQEVLTEGLTAALEASGTRMDALLELQQAIVTQRETQDRDRARHQEHLGALTRWLRERDDAQRKRSAQLEAVIKAVHAGLNTLQDSVRHDFAMLDETLMQLAQQEQLLASALDAVQQSDMNAQIQTSSWIQDQLGGLRLALAGLEREANERRTAVEALRHAHEQTARQVESVVRMISKASRPEMGS